MVSKSRRHVKPFEPGFFERLKGELKKIADSVDQKPIAAFDGDGTLWDVDHGDSFLLHQIAKSALKNLPPEPWKHFKKLRRSHREQAYLWTVQINQGVTLEQLRNWSFDYFKSLSQFPFFQGQKDLICWLQELDFEIYIVTMSMTWAIEPLAEHLKINPENVLGFETQVNKGRISDSPIKDLPCDQHKPKTLLKSTGGIRPTFCCGNTMSDFELLRSATHLRFAISAQTESEENYQTERELQEKAKQLGWFTYRLEA
jgi:phosphoserine phosphatase